MNQADFLQELPHVYKRLESGLIIPQLKDILRVFGLRLSGTKPELIARIKEFVEKIAINNDMNTWNSLKKAVDGDIAGAICTLQSNLSQIYPQTLAIPPPVNNPGNRSYTRPFAPIVHSRIRFRKTPFYDILEPFNTPFTIPACVGARNTVSFSFQLTPMALSKLLSNPKEFRVYFFSTPTDTIGFGECLMEYPTPQMELRANNQVAHANYRGLKGRSGTTNPADITDYITKYAGPPGNNVVIYYMNATKRYSAVVSLVKMYSVDHLIDDIKSRKIETKEKIVDRIKSENEDTDIIATSTDISLKCPLSFTRISLPVRSSYCKHIQCFDARAFLEMNQQTPSWMCPVCNIHIRYPDLVVDGFMQHILENSPSNSETITVDPVGNWSMNTFDEESESSEEENSPKEQVIELSDEERSAAPENTSEPPIAPKRKASPPSAAPTNKKKRESLVIDLTISDDEEPVASASPTISTTNETDNSFSKPTSPNPARKDAHVPSSTPSETLMLPQTSANGISQRSTPSNTTPGVSTTSTFQRSFNGYEPNYAPGRSAYSNKRPTESFQSSRGISFPPISTPPRRGYRLGSLPIDDSQALYHPSMSSRSSTVHNTSPGAQTASASDPPNMLLNDLVLPPMGMDRANSSPSVRPNTREPQLSNSYTPNRQMLYNNIPTRPPFTIPESDRDLLSYDDIQGRQVLNLPQIQETQQRPPQTAGPLWNEEEDNRINWDSEFHTTFPFNNPT
ncbi:SUMO E3 ligase Pli1 [Schizosaccharomyces octosporus yFS286]|uniref:SUMO E3 ligase Pli1 n=1 Tax=Schizosaccharomyces octosporus (strain yFS286) TaxID=483514 RepID=S9RL11_SCHOY|nr:SUMO E3 ligase Pli1 [Schizosaccharomyces octosporus yFS286]EPX74614.1 SUMO E3 ligase Pli1 [Schizosaccharomyces octosporus yFS286]